MLITLALIGVFVLTTFSAIDYFQPQNGLVIYDPKVNEESLWQQFLSLGTISTPIVQLPEIENRYPLMSLETEVQSHVIIPVFGIVLIIWIVLAWILCRPVQQKSIYANKVTIHFGHATN